MTPIKVNGVRSRLAERKQMRGINTRLAACGKRFTQVRNCARKIWVRDQPASCRFEKGASVRHIPDGNDLCVAVAQDFTQPLEIQSLSFPITPFRRLSI